MKKIETTNIAGTQDAPFIKATFDHLNEANLNSTSDIIKGLLGTYTTNDIIVLFGCVVTATIPGTSSITAGAIYYNGEIYEVDANASLVTTGSDILVWGIATTYRAGDPIKWSDGENRNLHQIDKFALSAGLSGSGLANYNGATVKTIKSASILASKSQLLVSSISATGPTSYTTETTMLTLTPSSTLSAAVMKYTFMGYLSNNVIDTAIVRIKKNGSQIAITKTTVPNGQINFCLSWISTYTAADIITATIEYTADGGTIDSYILICESLNAI